MRQNDLDNGCVMVLLGAATFEDGATALLLAGSLLFRQRLAMPHSITTLPSTLCAPSRFRSGFLRCRAARCVRSAAHSPDSPPGAPWVRSARPGGWWCPARGCL